MAEVTICNDFGAPKMKSVTVSIVFPSICHEVMGLDVMILVFWMLSFKPVFSLSSFTFIKRLLSSSLISAIGMVSSAIWGCWYFSCQSWFQLVLYPAWHFTWCTLHISWISTVTIYSLDVLLSQFGTKPLFHVRFYQLLLDLHTDFSEDRSGGLVFPFLEEFSTICFDPHHQRFWCSQ